MSGKRSRDKGQRGEREVVELLKPLFPKAKRGFQSRGGGAEMPDVIGTPWHIEVKRAKKTRPKAALEQAEKDNKANNKEIAFCRDDNDTWIVVMRADTFLQLAEEFSHGREQ